MNKIQSYWEMYYKPGSPVYWFQVPNKGSMKFSYDNIVQKHWGRKWYMPILTIKRTSKISSCPTIFEYLDEQEEILDDHVKIGSIILFGVPKKIVDIFLITNLEEDKIILSPVFFSMLWKDLNFIPPIPACYQTPRRNHPVKLIDKYKFEQNIDQIFDKIYGE